MMLLFILFQYVGRRNDLLLLVLAVVAETWFRGPAFFALGFIVHQRNLIGVLLYERNRISFIISVGLFIGVYFLKLGTTVSFSASFLFITSLSGLLYELFPQSIGYLASFSFCIYAAHEPVLTILGRVMQKMPVLSEFPVAIFSLPQSDQLSWRLGLEWCCFG